MGLVSLTKHSSSNKIMNISPLLISKILEERGYLNFKPFVCGKKEIYGYRKKNDSEFHFCDSNLKELNRDDIGLPPGPLFVLGIGDEYKILEEGCDVKDKLSHPNKNCLLVDRNNIIRHSYIEGYVKLNETYYVLKPSLNIVDSSQVSGIVKTDYSNTDSIVAYNANEDSVFFYTEYKAVYNYYYYWSYESCHILYFSGKYIVLIGDKEYVMPFFPSLWVKDGKVDSIVYLNGKKGVFSLNIIELCTNKTNTIVFSQTNSTLNHYDEECDEENFDFDTFDVEKYIEPPYSCGSQFYADKNIICVVMQKKDVYDRINSTILIADKNSWKYYFYGNLGDNRKFISIDNGIITLEERFNITDLGYRYDTKMVYLDLDFSVLAETDYKYHKYVVISRRNRKIADNNETELNDENYTLSGVLLNSNKTLVVPIRYESIEIIDEYAIVGNVYKINGINQMLYGLLCLKDLSLIIPIQYCYLKVYIDSSNFNIVIGQLSGNGKNKKMVYGMFCNGKLLMPIKYEEITPICYSGCMRFKQRKKYGLFYDEKIYIPAVYDKISEYNDYLVLEKNNKKGIISIPNKFLSPISFDNVELIANKTILIGDNDLFLIKGKKLECIVKGKGRLSYLNSRTEYHIFRSVLETDKLDSSNYECHKISSLGNDLIVGVKNVDKFGTIKDEYGNMRYIRNGDYLCIDDGVLYYEVNKNRFYERNSILEPDYSSYDDNWDYERDTYYALGGSDYDQFKEEGGDIDSMMEGMGY